MKSSWFVVGIILLLVAVCGGTALAIGNQFTTPKDVTATATIPAALMPETIATMEREPTATSTATPWPTADLRYLEAAKAEAEIAEKNANAAQSQANAQSTTVANAGIIATITKAYEYDVATQEAGTATAAPSVTAQAYQVIQRVNDETLRTQQESEKSRNESIKELIVWGVGGALVLVAGVVVAYAIQIGLHNMAQKVYDQRDQEAVTNVAESDELPKEEPMVAHLHTDAGTIKRISNPLVTDAIFRDWAEHVTTGDSAAIDAWETAESPFKGRMYRDYFYPWLVKNSMLTRGTDGRTVLSNIGADYCRGWLARHTTSPIELTTPNTTPTATVHTENGHGNTEGEVRSGGEGA